MSVVQSIRKVGEGKIWKRKNKFQERDFIEIGPHGQHQLSNKKESSKLVHPVATSEITNLKIMYFFELRGFQFEKI